MNVKLVKVKTDDGVRLHGALAEPVGRLEGSVDAVVLIHGVGSNFYGSVMMETLASALREKGIATLAINTRGHDAMSTASTDTGGRLLGAAFETVADCQADLAAWTDFLVESGYGRVAWLGHSLGAIKALFAAARRPHSDVCRIVAISPPCLSHSRLMSSESGSPFQTSYAAALQLAEDGNANRLFEATFPFPLVISAGTFLDKYGPAERYNILRFAANAMPAPAFVFGGNEMVASNPAFHRLDRDLLSLDWKKPPAIEIVEGANHFYTGRFPELNRRVLELIE